MDKNKQTYEINARDILAAIFRQKHFVIIIVPVVVLVVLIGLLFQTNIYEASVKMHIVGKSQITADTYYDIGVRSIHRTQMEIVKSNVVIKRAAIALKLDKRPLDYEKNFCHPLKYRLIDFLVKSRNAKIKDLSKEELNELNINIAMNTLKNNTSTSSIPGTDLFTITVRDYTREDAVAAANVLSRSYVIFDLQQQLAELTQKYGLQHPSVQQLRDNIYSMAENLSGKELPDLEAIGTASVKIIEQATASDSPVGKPKRLILLAAIVASLGMGVGIAFMYDFFVDQTFKSPNEIAKFTGLPLLGSSPIKKQNDSLLINNDTINLSKSEILYSDFIEDLADQLFIYMKVNNQKTILITSAFPKGGSSTICANLGICLSNDMNLKTLLIDANFRNPSLHKLFNIKDGIGLSNMLEESKLIEYHAMMSGSENEAQVQSVINNLQDKAETYKVQPASYNDELISKTSEIINHIDSRLDLLQSGNSSLTPFTLFNDMKIDAIFKITKTIYDAVIIDCTNLKEFKDAGILSSHADGVVLVVNDGKEKRQIVINSINYIKQKNGNPIGVILNRRRFPIPQMIYRWV